MKLMILAGGVGLLGLAAYGVGSVLSPDAIALLLGVAFGILATAPALVLAAIINMRRPPAPTYSPPTYQALPPASVQPQRQLPPPTEIVVGRGAYQYDPREQDRCKRLEARRRRADGR